MQGLAPRLDHQRAQALFAPLVDHELAPSDEAALRSHLDGCADCQRGLERYVHAVELVRGSGRVAAPVDFTSKVLKRVRRRRSLLWGAQGGKLLEQMGSPAGLLIPLLIAALVAAVMFTLGSP